MESCREKLKFMKSVRPLVVPVSLRPLRRGCGSRRSSALLLVLGMIVLLSALVLAFLASVNTQLSTSQIYANGATVKQLADSTTQLAISQIVTATGNTNSTLAWASQPGMIRTYSTNGSPAQFYKLYSSTNMVVNGASFVPANEVPPDSWSSASSAGLYTDINSPVSSNGTNYFPIIDPSAVAPSQAVTNTTLSGSSTPIEGCFINTATTVTATSSTQTDPIPMPVQWLYVLQDGTIATPTSSNAGTVTFDASNAPTPSNPIVGRIAFWTDDETCKVNINTASEGTYWDRPMAHTATEEKYSTAIPVQNEFQRYPGHSSKTCLSPVMDSILPSPAVAWQSLNPNILTAYYTLTPRIAPGGTQGGAVDDTAATAIPAKADRLYTSSDEFLYSTTYTGTTPLTRMTNGGLSLVSPYLTNAAAFNNTYMEKAQFFLTAHSRAPELNLFGKPRITLWPIQMNTNLRNAKDQLIAFCSTINGKAYYFQRQNVYTTFGAACSSQDPTADWTATDSTGETRNQTLYGYLDQLTSNKQNIPGFGGNFDSQYPTTRRQILTEMFDVIRSGVNSYSTGLTPTYTYTPQLGDSGEGQVVPLAPSTGTAAGTRGFGRFATITGATIDFYRCNVALATTNSAGAVISPLQLTSATATPQIAAVVILQPFTPSPGLPAWSPNVHYVISGLQNFGVKPSSGGGYTPLGFPASPDNWAMGRMCYSGAQNSTAGNTTALLSLKGFFRCAVAQGTGFNGDDYNKVLGPSTTAAPDKTKYPFFSNAGASFPITGIPISTGTTFDFSGGSIQIMIYADSNGKPAGLPLQTINMNFPEALNLPLPTTAAKTTTGVIPDSDYSNRFMGPANSTPSGVGTQNSSRDPRLQLIECQDGLVGNDPTGKAVVSRTMDVARSVQADPNGPAKGDLRFYAALPVVPASYFTTSSNYTNPAVPIDHALRDGAYAGSYANGNTAYGWDMGTANSAEAAPTASTPGYPFMKMHV